MRKYKSVAGALLGTIVEYYDYSLYGFSASVIASKFFPGTDEALSLSKAFAVYAVAYFSKPFGAFLFGRIGDKFGRKIALNLTIAGIVTPTFIIGLLPTYQVWGMLSVAILIFCRIMQGIFTAGEYDGAAIYVIEHFGQKYRYTASALSRTTAALGLLLGIGSVNFFNSHIFYEYGWRIPFLLSLPLACVALYYRRYMTETPSFDRLAFNSDISWLQLFVKHGRTIFTVAILAGSFGVTYQVSVIFMKEYLPLVLPQTKIFMSTFSISLVIALVIAMPLAGICADRCGKMLIIRLGTVLSIISCILMIVAIQKDMLNLALVSSVALVVSIAPFNALAHGAVVSGFGVRERYRGISLGHTLGSMLISGSANYLCIHFMNRYNVKIFPIIYVMFFSIIAYAVMSEIYNKHGVKNI